MNGHRRMTNDPLDGLAYDCPETQQSCRTPAAHRAGVATQLKEIRAEIQDLRVEMRQVVRAALTRKSVANSESRNAD
jgi:hypothetical protein